MMRARPSENGAALLTVLLIVAVMAVLAATALEHLKLATRLSANGGAIEQARAFARAGETVATYRIGDLIQRDAARTTLDGDWKGRPTNFPIEGGLATARIDDGGNCFNLNALVDKGQDGILTARLDGIAQFVRLLTLLEVPGREAGSIAAASADWIDSDAEPLPGGAEDGAYASLDPAYRTANTLMADSSELRMVAGVTPAIYSRVRPFVCALPVTEPTAINVNTLDLAQAPLLAMLVPTLDPARARAALDKRPQSGWETLSTFWNLPELASSPPTDAARGQVRLTTRWFDVALTIELADAELEDHVLIDAQSKPAKVARRSYGAPS